MEQENLERVSHHELGVPAPIVEHPHEDKVQGQRQVGDVVVPEDCANYVPRIVGLPIPVQIDGVGLALLVLCPGGVFPILVIEVALLFCLGV